MPYVAAIVGFTLCLLVVQLCQRIENPVARYALMVPGVLAGLVVAAMLGGSKEAAVRAGICIAGLAMACALAFAEDKPTN